MAMENLIILFRILAISQLLLTVVQGLLGAPRSKPAGYMALFALTVIGHLLNEQTYRDFSVFLPLRLGFIALSALAPWAFWLWVKSWFEAESRFKGAELGFAPLIVAWVMLGPQASFAAWWVLGINLTALLFLGLSVLVVGRDWRDDLREPRRKARVVLLGIMAATALLIVLKTMQDVLIGGFDQVYQLVGTGAIFLWAFTANLVLLDLGGLLGLKPRKPEVQGLNEEARWVEILGQLMERDRVYCTPGLTIKALSLLVGLPEYKLRRLINQELGYDNFNSFLNEYRVKQAAELLRHSAESVLEIGLSVGFNSLPPFNRAFRAQFGCAPSDYRKQPPVKS